jgi:hypothetical protein
MFHLNQKIVNLLFTGYLEKLKIKFHFQYNDITGWLLIVEIRRIKIILSKVSIRKKI